MFLPMLLPEGGEMKKQKLKLRRILMPNLTLALRLLLYAATVILSALSILEVVYGYVNEIIGSFIYGLSACAVGLSCCYLYRDLRYGVNEKLRPGLEAHPLTERVVRDYRYRTMLSNYLSLAVNLLFAVSNGAFGILYHSVWFGALSAYYIVLGLMRFSVVRYERRVAFLEETQRLKRELKVCGNCGIMFILLTLALGVSVIQMVYFDQGKSYSQTLILAVAAYSFYKVTLAIINVIKVRKLKSPLLMTIRDIGYADAFVSMLSLQSAMFVAFGGDGTVNPRVMNSITGGCVCLMILTMGIYMFLSSNRQRRRMGAGAEL